MEFQFSMELDVNTGYRKENFLWPSYCNHVIMHRVKGNFYIWFYTPSRLVYSF